MNKQDFKNKIKDYYSRYSEDVLKEIHDFYFENKEVFTLRNRNDFLKLCYYIIQKRDNDNNIEYIFYCLIDNSYQNDEYDLCIEYCYKLRELFKQDIICNIYATQFMVQIMIELNNLAQALVYLNYIIKRNDFCELKDKYLKLKIYALISYVMLSLYRFEDANHYMEIMHKIAYDELSLELISELNYYFIFLDVLKDYYASYLDCEHEKEERALNKYISYYEKNKLYYFDRHFELIKGLVRNGKRDIAIEIINDYFKIKEVNDFDLIKLYKIMIDIQKVKQSPLATIYEDKYIKLLQTRVDKVIQNQKMYVQNANRINKAFELMQTISLKVDIDELTKAYTRNKYSQLTNEDFDFDGFFVFFDMNHLKLVNDTLGHKMGDDLLRRFSSSIRKVFDEDIDLYRIGGDEFIMIYKKMDEAKITHKFDELINVCTNQHISFSAGISEIVNGEFDLFAATNQADRAMYHSKNTGQCSYSFYSKIEKND